MQSINQKTISSVAHLGAFSKYFIPFGNFLVPIIIWVLHKEKPFVSAHAKRSLNFQISLFLYAGILVSITIFGVLFLGINLGNLDQFYFSVGNDFVISNHSPLLTTPFLLFIVTIAILALVLFFFEILFVINATVRAGEGKTYHYPLTINFIRLTTEEQQDLQEQIFQTNL